MSKKIKITTQLDAVTFRKLSGYLNWQKLKPLAYLIGVIIVGVIIAQFVQFSFEEASVRVLSYMLPVGIIGVIWWLILRWSNKRGFENNPLLGEHIVYTFDKKNIHIKGESFESKLSWEMLHKVEETPDFMLIYQTKMMANGLPKTQMSKEEVIAFRALVRQINGLEHQLFQ